MLDWCSRNTLSVRTAGEPDTLRRLRRAVTRKLDGQFSAPTVARKTRSVLWNVFEYAVQEELLSANPLTGVKWTAMPKGKRKVDKRAVPNPVQARTLLNAVREVMRSGPRLVAFFGTMYYSALRPEEAAALNIRAGQRRFSHVRSGRPWQDSNLRHLPPEGSALSPELQGPVCLTGVA